SSSRVGESTVSRSTWMSDGVSTFVAAVNPSPARMRRTCCEPSVTWSGAMRSAPGGSGVGVVPGGRVGVGVAEKIGVDVGVGVPGKEDVGVGVGDVAPMTVKAVGFDAVPATGCAYMPM